MRSGEFNIESVLAVVDRIPGWLTLREAALLHELARDWQGNGRTVELGSYQGRSTVCLALGLRARGGDEKPLIAVDTHAGSAEHWPGGAYHDPEIWDPVARRVDTLPALRRNLSRAGVDAGVDVWRMTTLEAARRFRGTVRLLFVDASHEASDVEADVKAWAPFLERGGIIVLHDVSTWPGPTRVAESLLADPAFRLVSRQDSALALALRHKHQEVVMNEGTHESEPAALAAEDSSDDPMAHPLTLAKLSFEGNRGAQDRWRPSEGSRWRWDPESLTLESTTTEWSVLELPGPVTEDFGNLRDFVIEVTVEGAAEAAGLSFGPFKDFLIPLLPTQRERRLQLEVDVRSNRWTFRADGELIRRWWWNGAAIAAGELLSGKLTFKAWYAKTVRFSRFDIKRYEEPCRISVVLTAYRWAERLGVVLQSWCNQEVPTGIHEVVVVNPSSPDATRQTIAAFSQEFPRVRLRGLVVEETIATNKGALVNRGCEAAQGEWVWIADADCIFSPHAIVQVLRQVDGEHNRLFFGERFHLSRGLTDALIARRRDPVKEFEALERDAAASPLEAAPWGYTQIVHGSVLARTRYREDIWHYAWSDGQFVEDLQRSGVLPRQMAALRCLHMHHPFAWPGTETSL